MNLWRDAETRLVSAGDRIDLALAGVVVGFILGACLAAIAMFAVLT